MTQPYKGTIIGVFAAKEGEIDFAYNIEEEPILCCVGRCDDGSTVDVRLCYEFVQRALTDGITMPGGSITLPTGNPEVFLKATIGEEEVPLEDCEAFQAKMCGATHARLMNLSVVKA